MFHLMILSTASFPKCLYREAVTFAALCSGIFYLAQNPIMDKATQILNRVRRIELKARKLATETLAGHYHSGFRGQGLDFDDFREYQTGDDPRFIDWKVTARMMSPYVRRFLEEREQALILSIDASSSMRYASDGVISSKLDYAAEIAAVLAFSAVQSGDKCGLLLFRKNNSFYLPPAKGVRQALRIVREIISAPPGEEDAPLQKVAESLLHTLKKTAMIVLVSDFLMETDRPSLGKLAFRHELIPIRVQDPRELHLPDSGRLIGRDPETGHTWLIPTSKQEIREAHDQAVASHRKAWTKDFQQLGLDFLDLDNTVPYLPPLKALFAKRASKFAH